MRKTLPLVIAVLVLGGLLSGVWEGVKYFFTLLTAASPEVEASIIGGMSTAFVAIAAALLAHRFARVRASDDAHRLKKVEIYRAFLEIVARQIANTNDKARLKPLPESELITFLINFRSDIILWGSPAVLNAFRAFTKSCASGGVEAFHAIDHLYRAIRSDIGLSNRGLESLALVKMYLNDPSELDAMIAANNSIQRTQTHYSGSRR